jgi:hypothetical protein
VREHGISIILSNFSLSTSWRSCSETAAERKSTGFGAGRRVLGPEETLVMDFEESDPAVVLGFAGVVVLD